MFGIGSIGLKLAVRVQGSADISASGNTYLPT